MFHRYEHSLLKECQKVEISVTNEQIKIIEKDTITQAKGGSFYQHRAGRIGASKCHAVCNSDPTQPLQSLIKTICYTDVFNFSTAATRYGCKHEDVAIAEYEKQMKLKYENFKVVKCGTFINKDFPFLHATPDFLCSCDCCGPGLDEQSSCLEKNDSKFVLKKSHSYYSQVQQQQLHTVPDQDYCDFVVFAVQNDFVQLIQERITPDNIHWQQQLPKLSLFWRICILLEIMGRWYARKLNMKTPPAVQVDGDCGDCGDWSYARKVFHNLCQKLSLH